MKLVARYASAPNCCDRSPSKERRSFVGVDVQGHASNVPPRAILPHDALTVELPPLPPTAVSSTTRTESRARIQKMRLVGSRYGLSSPAERGRWSRVRRRWFGPDGEVC